MDNNYFKIIFYIAILYIIFIGIGIAFSIGEE
jgi:hypothetical protein